MHLEYLRYFNEVATMGSISKVANSSHISQPALSQQIQKLEDILGYKLLVRSNKGVELTEAGQIVEKYSKNLIKSYDNMLEDLMSINKNNNTIRIDSSPSIATYALPCTIYNLKEEYPSLKINLTTNLVDSVEQNVLNDICDFGFIQGRPHESGLHYTRVGMDRMVVVGSHEFPCKQEVSLSELRLLPLIMLLEKFRITRELKTCLQQSGYDLGEFNLLFSLDSIESIKSTVFKGYGISFLPYISVKKELYTRQLREIKTSDFKMDYEIYLIYKADKEMSPGIRNCIQYYKRIGEKSFC